MHKREESVTLFLSFPRTDPIALEDKNVEFEMKLGPSDAQAQVQTERHDFRRQARARDFRLTTTVAGDVVEKLLA